MPSTLQLHIHSSGALAQPDGPSSCFQNALIIDDSATDRLILHHSIARFGFHAIEATNGRDGLRHLAKASGIGLILVDWNMPEISGLQFVKVVRSIQSYASIPIIMVTIREKMAFIIEAIRAGANEYLMKPYALQGLKSKLRLVKPVFPCNSLPESVWQRFVS